MISPQKDQWEGEWRRTQSVPSGASTTSGRDRSFGALLSQAVHESPETEWYLDKVLSALVQARDASAVPQLLSFVSSGAGSTGERQTAAHALARIGTRESVAPLLSLVREVPPGERRFGFAMSLADELAAASKRTQDATLIEELLRLEGTMRAMAREGMK